jgi:hypothetical protein
MTKLKIHTTHSRNKTLLRHNRPDYGNITHRRERAQAEHIIKISYIDVTRKGIQMKDTFTDVCNNICDILIKTYIHK